MAARGPVPRPPTVTTMPDPYERYLADLASADGMPEARPEPETASPLTRAASEETAEE
jgi:hypothetical protein